MRITANNLCHSPNHGRLSHLGALMQDVLLTPIKSSVISLPHQILAEAGDRVRYLLVDDVDFGKTIDFGLILRELDLLAQNERSFPNTSIRTPMSLPTWRR